MAKIGFIGLGIMGRPMALNLLRGGHTLRTHSRSGTPAELQEAGAVDCADARTATAGSGIVITMLPDTPDVERVLFGPDGVAAGLTRGTIVVDMSSISPLETRTFARRIRDLGGEYLDAPVSGGDVGARNGTLTIMVGGSQEAFDAVLPVFQLMGQRVTRVGGPGDGQTCKVANQIVVALTLEAVAEALVFASKAGADPGKVREALLGGFAASRILEVHGERMIRRAFDPGFRIELHQKDLHLALAGARALGVSLPNTATTQELFNACVARGDAGRDHSAIVRAIERLAEHVIAADETTGSQA